VQLTSLLDALFPNGHSVGCDGVCLSGTGQTGRTSVAVTGTTAGTTIGVELALQLAGEVLRIVREHPGRPILLLVDTTGQRLSRRDEMLGINHYLAHLAKCIEVARRRGHRVLSLVYSQAVSGGYLACGMQADICCALPEAEIRVMSLPAMARVTKIPQQKLEALSRSSPVFAPGVANYFQMGALESLWEGNLADWLADALRAPAASDLRRDVGKRRGGRTHAQLISQRACKDEFA
jgi:malonate decarboxylase gamma subunit